MRKLSTHGYRMLVYSTSTNFEHVCDRCNVNVLAFSELQGNKIKELPKGVFDKLPHLHILCGLVDRSGAVG